MKSLPKTGNHSTTQAPSKDKCIIDYLSLVFDVEELERLKMQAKLMYQADRERTFQDYYKSLLTLDMTSNIDRILAGNIEQFIGLLNSKMNKSYYDLVEWNEMTGEGFNSADYAFWTIENNHYGRFKYAHSANLFFDGVLVGVVCWGAENFGAMISFTGKACGSIDFKAMHQICSDLGYVRISRIDLAHDDYKGHFNVDTCRKMFKNGLFTVTTEPSYQYIESGILLKNGSLKPANGRSFYVGKRNNGKMLRCYEKGKQLKDQDNPLWCRWEVELRNIDRVIPLDALSEPQKYFAGAYPALNQFSTSQERTKLKVKKLTASYKHLEKYAKQGYGKLLNFAIQVLGKTPEEIIADWTEGLEIDSFPSRIRTDALVLST